MTQRSRGGNAWDEGTAAVEAAIRALVDRSGVQPSYEDIQNEVERATGVRFSGPNVAYHLEKLERRKVIVRPRRGIWKLRNEAD